eukprot:CAMPEP_0183381856 /NCGR_PEP_ID=MMETSP0164_2-20130417/126649_1 /TAXON_ID=221442 /ORGANISM="Coccolithus pelagicus ssp braarudi, Strain PLY182g" /LENGTH=121 /DNA_ID=CAMNT_0025559469 /DNA_START=310 /DNA_END=675 /DNA_ORIENTATION=+
MPLAPQSSARAGFWLTQRQRRDVLMNLASHLEKAMSETRHCWYVSSSGDDAYAGSSAPTWWPQPASQPKCRRSSSHELAHSSSASVQYRPDLAHASEHESPAAAATKFPSALGRIRCCSLR